MSISLDEFNPVTGRQERCVVCRVQLTWAEARMSPVCRNVSCIAEYKLHPDRKWHAQQQDFRQQREEREIIRRAAEQKLLLAAAEIRNASAAAAQVADPETYTPAIVPANRRPLTRLPQERRDEFLRHLGSVLKEVAETPAPEQEPERKKTRAYPGALTVLSATCATCRGFCCQEGGTRAFLDVPTLRRYMRDNETKDLQEVEAAYVRHLPAETYQDSCVYHTQTGCALPPDMRASVCVTFGCSEFQAVQDLYHEEGRKRFFLAAMDNQQVLRFQFVDTQARSDAAHQS